MVTHPFGASGIGDFQKIRVAILTNSQIVHIPVLALLTPVLKKHEETERKIADLEQRLTNLERK